MLESFTNLTSLEKLSFFVGCFGTFVSIAGVILSVLIYKKQARGQKQMDNFVSSALDQLKSYEQAGFDLLVSLRNNNLQLFTKQFDNEERGYWHFKLRFETWDLLGLSVELGGGADCYIYVKIVGSTDDFRSNSLDGGAYEYFLCDVVESNDLTQFSVGDRVACFYCNDDRYVSKYVGRIGVPKIKFKFTIVGLGSPRAGSGGDILARELNSSPRAKDFKI